MITHRMQYRFIRRDSTTEPSGPIDFPYPFSTTEPSGPIDFPYPFVLKSHTRGKLPRGILAKIITIGEFTIIIIQ